MKQLSILVVALTLLSLNLTAQETRAFGISDILNQVKILDATISPSGKYAAVVIGRSKNDAIIHSYRIVHPRRDIWLLDIDSGKIELMLDGKKDSCSYWNPVWSPDGRHLAVLSTKGGDNIRTFIYNLQSKETLKVSDRGTNLMAKTYQGASGNNDPYLWVDSENLVLNLLPEGKSHNSFQIDHLPFQTIIRDWNHVKYNTASTASILDADSLQLFRKDQEATLIRFNLGQQTATILDTGFFRHLLLSPSGEKLFAVKRHGGPDFGSIPLVKRAWNFNHIAGVIDLSTLRKDYMGQSTLNAFATPGSQPHFWTTNEKYVIIRKSDRSFGTLDLKKQTFSQFGEEFTKAKQVGSSIYLNSGSDWLEFDEKKGKIGSPKILVEQNPEMEIPGKILASRPDAEIFLSRTEDDNGTKLILHKKGKARTIVTFNQWVSNIPRAKKELVAFQDAKGVSQKSLLLTSGLPSRGLVVSCYPGTMINENSIKRDYRFYDSPTNLLVLLGYGYDVLIPTIDTRSTDEYEEFADFVLPAVEEVVRQKNYAQDKIAIMGVSHGGYLVYSMITQTNRFKSAIALAGYGNTLSLYGTFDIRYRYTDHPFENVGRLRASESGIGGFRVPAHNNPEKYVKNSPIMYSDKVETPLLIIQGDKDFVPIEQGEEMFTHLLRQGKSVRFLRFWGEGHTITAPKNIKKMWEEMIRWLEETLE